MKTGKKISVEHSLKRYCGVIKHLIIEGQHGHKNGNTEAISDTKTEIDKIPI